MAGGGTYPLGTVVVNEGDTGSLEIVGINGEEHPIIIEGYAASTVIKRGEVKRLTLVADRPGIFKIVRAIHAHQCRQIWWC